MKELWIDLQPDSPRALYEQIYEYIRKDIADGKISPGEKLPSTRFMAKNLQISRSTVELAYEQLTAEGYIEPKPCAGYFVCDISMLYQLSRGQEKPEEGRLMERQKKQYEISFSPYEIDRKHFPYGIWYRMHKSVVPEDNPDLLLSGNPKGELNLRTAISRYLYQARGVVCDEKQILLGAGNEYLLLLLAQIMGRDKKVAMENYTYLQAYYTFCNMGYRVLAEEIDEDGICMEAVRKENPDMVYVMPSHQFPLGNVMPLRRRLELLQWASEGEERYIIEDDHDSEFRYKGKPIPALWGNDTGEHVIYIGTFSKSIAPSLRISFMVLPHSLMERYHSSCGFYACTVPRNSQEVLCHFMEEGHFERHLNRMRNNYKNKHDTFMRLLKQEDWVCRIYGDNAGLHVLVELDVKWKEEEVVEQARKQHIEIHGLGEYVIQKPKEKKVPTLVLGYGNLTEDEMEQGLAVLREILDK